MPAAILSIKEATILKWMDSAACVDESIIRVNSDSSVEGAGSVAVGSRSGRLERVVEEDVLALTGFGGADDPPPLRGGGAVEEDLSIPRVPGVAVAARRVGRRLRASSTSSQGMAYSRMMPASQVGQHCCQSKRMDESQTNTYLCHE